MSARARALAELIRVGAFDWRRRASWRSALRTAQLLVRPAKLARLLELDVVKNALVPARGAEAVSFLTSPRFLARTLSLEQRVDCALHHYAYEQATFSSAYVDAVYRGSGLVLWRATSEEGGHFSIRLMLANDNLFEGCLSVVAFVDEQRVCVMSFAYVDAALFGRPPGTALFVTRKQSGRHPEEQSAFARAFHHSSPPYFCVAALAGVALANGASELLAIRHEAHASYQPGDAQALRVSYDEFWAVYGASEVDEKASRIPLPLELGDLAEVSTKHRRRAKLRRQHWAQVAESAREALRLHTRRACALLVALVVALAGAATAGDWKPVKIGGGGFLTGIDLSPDGTTRCVRTDTYGAYCDDAAHERWQQVVTARTMPAADVYAFGFGKAGANGYPATFIAGWVRGAYGIWRCSDEGATWTRLGGEYALDSLDAVKTIDGDKDEVRTVYVGFAGSGYAYYEMDAPSIPTAH